MGNTDVSTVHTDSQLATDAPEPFDPELYRLRAAAEAESRRLSFVSHDLNNNLGAVSLHLSLLAERLAASAEFAKDVALLEAAQQAIQHTTQGTRRLIRGEQLRGECATLKLEPINLSELARHIAAQAGLQAAAKGVGVSVDVPGDAVVNSDCDLIALVLQNLIGNAVKYSSGGTVRVRSRRLSHEGWVMSVSDQGPGIAPHRLGQIFGAFERGESHGREGAGLGLAIAAAAAELLGAELSVASQVGLGSTFHLAIRSLPVGQGCDAPVTSGSGGP